ncbi:hypothetical protein AYO44_03620 [Planctomycetaceae bacterium SCGC AG-212-F19]|nr:hypothetical protein AYO44_03620 [Planctomycetaceae bacterium SCGC AG-212-F19]
MVTNRPLVSVIVPAYNREDFLGAALSSIVTQDYRPLEVIVVDDGSTDGTVGVARSFPEVRCLCQAHQGVSAARNAGVAASQGNFLAFLDSDDCWAPRKLGVQVDFLLQHPGIDFCLGLMQNFLEPGCRRPSWVGPDELAKPRQEPSPCTMVIRRAAFDRVGGYDTRFTHGEDTEWFFRAKEAGISFSMLPDTLLYRRIHDANLSATKGPTFPILARIIQAAMERQRRGNKVSRER